MRKRKAIYVILQLIVGCAAGVLSYEILLNITNLIWQQLEQVSINEFLKALLILVSFVVITSGFIAAIGESVKVIGVKLTLKNAPRKRVYEGAFLGMCTAVAILSVTRGEWMYALEEWGGMVRLVATFLYFLIVLPIKFLTFWIPSVALLIISAPIGAVISYNYLPKPKPDDTKKEEKGWRTIGKRGSKKGNLS